MDTTTICRDNSIQNLSGKAKNTAEKSLDIGPQYVVVLGSGKGAKIWQKREQMVKVTYANEKTVAGRDGTRLAMTPTGKRIIKNVLGKTKAEVKEKLASALEDTKDLDVSRSDDYTVGSWLTNWYTLYAKPNVRVSTAEYYRRSIEFHVNPRMVISS